MKSYLCIKLLHHRMVLVILAWIDTYLSSLEMASLLRSYFSIIRQKYFIQARKKRLFLTPRQILNLTRLWKIVTDHQFLVSLDHLEAKITFSWQKTCTWSCSKHETFFLTHPVVNDDATISEIFNDFFSKAVNNLPPVGVLLQEFYMNLYIIIYQHRQKEYNRYSGVLNCRRFIRYCVGE